MWRDFNTSNVTIQLNRPFVIKGVFNFNTSNVTIQPRATCFVEREHPFQYI